jgi:hypothetical protein
MKKSDIAAIILIASLSAMTSFFIAGYIPQISLTDASVNVKTIERYSTKVDDPSEKVFGSDAINPTVDVTIGDNSNTDDQ